MLSSLSAFDAFGILLVLKTNNEKGSGAYAGMSPQAQTYKSHNRRSAAGRSGASCQACRPVSEGHPDGRGGSGSRFRSRWELWCRLTVPSKVMRARTAKWLCQAKQRKSVLSGQKRFSGPLVSRHLKSSPGLSILSSPVELWLGWSKAFTIPATCPLARGAGFSIVSLRRRGSTLGPRRAEGLDHAPRFPDVPLVPIRDALQTPSH